MRRDTCGFWYWPCSIWHVLAINAATLVDMRVLSLIVPSFCFLYPSGWSIRFGINKKKAYKVELVLSENVIEYN